MKGFEDRRNVASYALAGTCLLLLGTLKQALGAAAGDAPPPSSAAEDAAAAAASKKDDDKDAKDAKAGKAGKAAELSASTDVRALVDPPRGPPPTPPSTTNHR